MIPAEAPRPRIEEFVGEDGKMHSRVSYHCLTCRDTGLITYEDSKQRMYGKPCSCAAGRYYYGVHDENSDQPEAQ